MTDDRDLLLSAVLDAPADDTARLVYADILDELGGARNCARAELIRVQVEIARTPHAVSNCDGSVEIPNPALAPLRARAHAILKRWAASFLPQSLRAGFVSSDVEGAIVYCAALGGYVTFERGFVARAGCELPLSPGATGPAALRFGQRVAGLFEANPLVGFSVSFEGHGRTLCAEIGSIGILLGGEEVRKWLIGWDNSVHTLDLSLVQPPIACRSRHELGRGIAAWLHHAIMAPAELAEAEIDAEAAEDEPPAVHVEPLPVPEFNQFAEMDAYIAQLRAQILESLRYQGPNEPESPNLANARATLAAFEKERERAATTYGPSWVAKMLPAWLADQMRKGDL